MILSDARSSDPLATSSGLRGVSTGSHALFLDVDGTLLEIAHHPDAVGVPHGLIPLLESLSERMAGALALVSGRTIARLDDFFTPLRLAAAGAHGGEIRLAPHGPVMTRADLLRADLRQRLAEIRSDFPGAFAEDKGTAVAVHYRAAPEIGPALGRALADILAEQAPELSILPGHMVFEVKGAAHTKGTAVAAFLEQPAFLGRVPVFVGDDVTDEAGFRAVRAQGGLAISVGRKLPGADTVLAGPGAVRAWLETLLDEAPQAAAGAGR